MVDSTGTGVKAPKCYCQPGYTGDNCELTIPNFPWITFFIWQFNKTFTEIDRIFEFIK